MSINAKSSGNTPKELIPSGSHVARCYEMIHVGTVKESYLGEPEKDINKVRLTWELPNELRIFNEDKGEQPMVISKEYTLSMHEKANLRKDLESWRGQTFKEQEADNFDITKLLGVTCMLSIVHTTAKNGNEYANVSNVSGLPKGVEVPEQINPTKEFNYDDKFDLAFIEGLPDFIKDKIKSSKEYKFRIDEMESEVEDEKRIKSQDIQQAQYEVSPPDDDLPF